MQGLPHPQLQLSGRLQVAWPAQVGGGNMGEASGSKIQYWKVNLKTGHQACFQAKLGGPQIQPTYAPCHPSLSAGMSQLALPSL